MSEATAERTEDSLELNVNKLTTYQINLRLLEWRITSLFRLETRSLSSIKMLVKSISIRCRLGNKLELFEIKQRFSVNDRRKPA